VDSYDLVLRQKPQHPEMCELGPIANTDHSQTNFLLILHTFLPMRVTCYRTKDSEYHQAERGRSHYSPGQVIWPRGAQPDCKSRDGDFQRCQEYGPGCSFVVSPICFRTFPKT